MRQIAMVVLIGAMACGMEGAAEFTGEQIAGKVAYSQFRASTKGREKEIETAFLSDQDKTDLFDWLFNGTVDKPGDLASWVGYFREILEMTDPKAFLAKSGWYRAIQLQ